MLQKLKTFLAETLGWLLVFLIAMGTGIALHAYCLELYLVDGTSMLPTLHHADLVLVDKLTYRFRTPERGEIVAFEFPSDISRSFVKRVIGIPGDRVAVQDGHVVLNGTVLTETYTSERIDRDFPEARVPEGTVFVLGDNRNNSEDSRYTSVGFVPTSLIFGRGLFVLWPGEDTGTLLLPKNEPIEQLGGGISWNLTMWIATGKSIRCFHTRCLPAIIRSYTMLTVPACKAGAVS